MWLGKIVQLYVFHNNLAPSSPSVYVSVSLLPSLCLSVSLPPLSLSPSLSHSVSLLLSLSLLPCSTRLFSIYVANDKTPFPLTSLLHLTSLVDPRVLPLIHHDEAISWYFTVKYKRTYHHHQPHPRIRVLLLLPNNRRRLPGLLLGA